MSQVVKRVLNAFIMGTLSALLVLALATWTDITNAVQANDWDSLKPLLVALVFGAVNGGLRALQAKTPIPSPEPDENPPPSG
jgi:hypothetical protein